MTNPLKIAYGDKEVVIGSKEDIEQHTDVKIEIKIELQPTRIIVWATDITRSYAGCTQMVKETSLGDLFNTVGRDAVSILTNGNPPSQPYEVLKSFKDLRAIQKEFQDCADSIGINAALVEAMYGRMKQGLME